MKDAKGHGSDSRGAGLTPAERGKADYASRVIETIRNAFTGTTGAHTAGIHSSTVGASLPGAAVSEYGKKSPAMDHAVAEIQRSFAGKSGGPGSSFGPRTPKEGSPNPGSNIRAVRRK